MSVCCEFGSYSVTADGWVLRRTRGWPERPGMRDTDDAHTFYEEREVEPAAVPGGDDTWLEAFYELEELFEEFVLWFSVEDTTHQAVSCGYSGRDDARVLRGDAVYRGVGFNVQTIDTHKGDRVRQRGSSTKPCRGVSSIDGGRCPSRGVKPSRKQGEYVSKMFTAVVGFIFATAVLSSVATAITGNTILLVAVTATGAWFLFSERGKVRLKSGVAQGLKKTGFAAKVGDAASKGPAITPKTASHGIDLSRVPDAELQAEAFHRAYGEKDMLSPRLAMVDDLTLEREVIRRTHAPS